MTMIAGALEVILEKVFGTPPLNTTQDFWSVEHFGLVTAGMLFGFALLGIFRSYRTRAHFRGRLAAMGADRERLTAELQLNDEANRLVIDSTSDGYWLIDADSLVIQRVNGALSQMLGYQSPELIGRSLLELFTDDAQPFMQEQARQIPTTGHRTYESEMRTRSGSRLMVHISATTLTNPSGRARRAFAFVRDITAIKEAEQEQRRQRAVLRSIIDSIPDYIFYKDEHSVYLGCNRAYMKRAGRSGEELVGCTDYDLYPREEAEFYREKDREMMASGESLRVDEVVYLPDGGRQYFDTLKTPFYGPDGEVLGLIGICRDVTQRRRAEERLRLTSVVFDCTSEAIMVTDARNHIITVNPAFSRITGYSREEAIGLTPSLLKSGRHGADFYREMWRSLEDTGRWEGEVWNRRKSGEIFPEWLSVTVVKGIDTQLEHYVAVFSDITRRREREDLIFHQANFDPLTELPNRALFHDRLGHAIAAAARTGTRLALMFLDLDRFKWVNDTLGHAAGDLLLQEAARRIQGCIRESDTLARLGGDEFTLILSDIGSERAAEVVAQKVLAELLMPFNLGGQEAFISGSIGITLYPNDGTERETLLKNADTAMYQAKELGRNGLQFFRQEMNASAVERVWLERALRVAVEHRELAMYYQPIVDLRCGRVIGMEALLRWNHPTRGLVMPMQFVPLADETGLIVSIGEWVLETTLHQMVDWMKAGLGPMKLAVNVSPRQCKDAGWLSFIQHALEVTGFPPSSLIVEITEGLLLEESPVVVNLLNGLRELGIKLSMDDFGTGYSSLSYLRRFPVDVLKIDKSFLAGVPGDAGSRTLIRAIVEMAHALNMEVVAEGVENSDQLEFLRDLGCDHAQGFLFSQPLDPAVVDAHLRNMVTLPLLASGQRSRPEFGRSGLRKESETQPSADGPLHQATYVDRRALSAASSTPTSSSERFSR